MVSIIKIVVAVGLVLMGLSMFTSGGAVQTTKDTVDRYQLKQVDQSKMIDELLKGE